MTRSVAAVALAAGLAAATLIAGIAWAIPSGSVLAELIAMARQPWGAVTLLDLYVGFAISAGWILVVEGRTWHRVLWLVLMLGLGNLATVLFVLARCRDAATVPAIFLRRIPACPTPVHP
jgi:hypothetical protein